jgi:hypothetical protein
MKRNIFAAIVGMVISTSALSQNLAGAMGHAYFGSTLNISSGIQENLRVPSLLGGDLQLNRFARLSGGGGYRLIDGRFLIGGSGFGYSVSDATARGKATLSMGGGFVNIGYLLFAKRNLMGFPYIGFGGYGTTLRLKNDTDDDFFNIDNKTINPGQHESLRSGGMGLEVGYSLTFLKFSVRNEESTSGFMIGLQAGTYFFTGIEDWHEKPVDGSTVDVTQAYLFTPYLRVTIGGGGFSSALSIK